MVLGMELEQLIKLQADIQRDIAKVMGQVSVMVPNALAPRTPVDTGHLRRSWKGRHTDRQSKIRNTAFYSDYVEAGTSRMSARPMIGPMIEPIVAEVGRAILTGTDFYIPGGAYPDAATQLKKGYKSKYGNYGSQRGYSG